MLRHGEEGFKAGFRAVSKQLRLLETWERKERVLAFFSFPNLIDFFWWVLKSKVIQVCGDVGSTAK